VDCWCLRAGDAALLECLSVESAKREPGLYASVDAVRPCFPKLHAIIPEALTRMTVEGVMERFVELGFPDALLSKLPPGGSPVKLSEW